MKKTTHYQQSDEYSIRKFDYKITSVHTTSIFLSNLICLNSYIKNNGL